MRRTSALVLVWGGLAGIAGASGAEPPPDRPAPADLVLKLGRVWTGDPERPWAEALAARRGEIVAVGTASDVARFEGPGTRVVERPDAFATPGLIDAHTHMVDLGALQEEIDLRGVKSVEEVARRVKAWIDAHPGDAWVLGQNWDQSLWPGGAFPTAAPLDAVAPDRPVWLLRVDGHAAWANSEAMRRAGVTKDTPTPDRGMIFRDAEGRPTGVFIDAAKRLVSRVKPRPTQDDFTRYILTAQGLVLRAGLTSVHDAGVSRLMADAYRALDREGRLKLRVYGMARFPRGLEVAESGHAPASAGPNPRFELRAIKFFIDGAMGSRGALMFESYSDDPGNTGLLLMSPERLRDATAEALRHGWQVATHAIGDRGNAVVLDAYEAALKAVPGAKDPRLRIEHAQVVRKSDVPRFAELGVIASMQPSHVSEVMRWAHDRLGPRRIEGAYAWRWFLDAHVHLAFGSDFPVVVVNPFYGLYAALTRQDESGQPPGGAQPEQKLTLDEALRAFTAGSAYAAFAEDRIGTLKPGMRADVTVVDRDLFRVSPRAVLESKVLMTIVDGEVLYEVNR